MAPQLSTCLTHGRAPARASAPHGGGGAPALRAGTTKGGIKKQTRATTKTKQGAAESGIRTQIITRSNSKLSKGGEPVRNGEGAGIESSSKVYDDKG